MATSVDCGKMTQQNDAGIVTKKHARRSRECASVFAHCNCVDGCNGRLQAEAQTLPALKVPIRNTLDPGE